MEIFDIKKELEGYDPEEIDRIKLLLQRINDTIEGGLRSANFKEYRNTYVINAQDSLDSTYPMYVHFNIISEMIKIVSIKLSFWLLPFRSYSKAGSAQGTPSGGGSTSGSGGGQTSSSVSTPSGGGSTSGGQGSASGGGSTSGAGGGQTSSSVSTPSGGGATSGSKSTPSGGGSTSGAQGSASGGGSTSGGEASNYSTFYGINTYETGTNVGDENLTGAIPTAVQSRSPSDRFHSHTTPAHTHPNHTHSTPAHTHPSHTHTTPNHTHPTHAHTVANHYHSTPNHTHPNHTHSTPNHTHPAHTHTVANHTHSTPAHTHPNHTHTAVYGIFEEVTSPTIMVYISRDNGLTYSLPIGSYTDDQEILDITSFINAAGSKMIKFTSSARARLSVQIEIKLDIKAR